MKYNLPDDVVSIRTRVEAHRAAPVAGDPYDNGCTKLHSDLIWDWTQVTKDVQKNRPEYEARLGKPVVATAEQELGALYSQIRELDAKHGLNEWAVRRAGERVVLNFCGELTSCHKENATCWRNSQKIIIKSGTCANNFYCGYLT